MSVQPVGALEVSIYGWRVLFRVVFCLVFASVPMFAISVAPLIEHWLPPLR
jgi:hypothetical protein